MGRTARGEAPAGRIALVGETIADVREVMVHGPSGLMSLDWGKGEKALWVGSKRRLELPNGAMALAFSSEDPESLRGPQFDQPPGATSSPSGAMPEATWDMLQFGLRLGERPRQVVTTTPRPMPLVKRLLADPETVTTKARTIDNAGNLAPAFLTKIVARYAGTRLGRQELDAELIEERSRRAVAKSGRSRRAALRAAPELRSASSSRSIRRRRRAKARMLAASSRRGSGPEGISATCSPTRAEERLSPARWAKRAVDLYHRLEADRIVAEVNQGGEMVEAVIRQADESVPVEKVRA